MIWCMPYSFLIVGRIGRNDEDQVCSQVQTASVEQQWISLHAAIMCSGFDKTPTWLQTNGGRNIEEVHINSPNSTKQLGIAIQTASSVLCGCGCGCEYGWETFTTWVRSLLKFMREVVTACLGVVLCPISVCIRDCTILFYHAWNCVELLRFLALKCVSDGPRMIRCEMQKSGLTGRRAGAFLAIGLVRCNGWSKTPGGKGKPSST